MSVDRFAKVYAALRLEFPDRGDVTLAVGIGDVSSAVSADVKGAARDMLIAFQESAETLVTDNVRQIRTIGVRLVAVSATAPRSKEVLKRATDALEAAASIRVFDMTGPAVDLETEGPLPEGVFITSQKVDLR